MSTNLLLLEIACAIVGATWIGWTMRENGGNPIVGAVLGAVAGAVGSGIVHLLLGGCTFEPDIGTAQFRFGLFAGAAGATAGIAAMSAVLKAGRRASGPGSLDGPAGASFGGGLMPLFLLAPTMFILALFLYWPALNTFRLATRLERLGAPRSASVCVRNFTELLDPSWPAWSVAVIILAVGLIVGRALVPNESDLAVSWSRFGLIHTGIVLLASWLFVDGLWSEEYVDVVRATAIISFFIVVLGLAAGLAIAVLVSSITRGATTYRVLLVWPYAVSPAVAGVLFFVLFGTVAGTVNYILGGTPIGAQLWLTSVAHARSVLVLSSLWKSLGFNILFYIAGLQLVSASQREAAQIDGASSWQVFRHIDLPSIAPITFFLLITNLTYSFFETYGTIDQLTKGGPAGATTTAIYSIVQVGIRSDRDLGRGAAQSLVLFAAVIAITVWQFRTTAKRVNYRG